MEKKLPLNIHDTEWKLLGEGMNKEKYRPLTDVEQYVPKIFIGFYSLLISGARSIGFVVGHRVTRKSPATPTNDQTGISETRIPVWVR